MPEKAKLQAMRMYPSECELSEKLAKYHKVRGRGRLFAKYMLEDVEKIKAEQSGTKRS